jgi:bifunctional DNase/RNase
VLVEVVVEALAVDEKNRSPVVILRDALGDRKIPIWIGHPEANAIAMELANRHFERPLTHDLMASILKGLGVRVQRIEISDLVENTFYAKIVLDQQGQMITIDARPSDSIALALKTKAKIYANAKLFSSEIESLLAGAGEPAEEVSDEQRAEELREFIENLDPKDFGKFRF